ncbi:MAG: hypothetical protein NUV57_02800 [archaeon]|nr:hypothetical protein [archaeon]
MKLKKFTRAIGRKLPKTIKDPIGKKLLNFRDTIDARRLDGTKTKTGDVVLKSIRSLLNKPIELFRNVGANQQNRFSTQKYYSAETLRRGRKK